MQIRQVLRKTTYLDVHEVVDINASEFRKLVSTLLQEACDIVTLLTLSNQRSARWKAKKKKKKTKTINSPQRSSGGHFHPSTNK